MADRVNRQCAALASLPHERLLEQHQETVRSVLAAVRDLGEVDEDAHPADIIDKHILRGNMNGDGVDVVPRGEVERLKAELERVRAIGLDGLDREESLRAEVERLRYLLRSYEEPRALMSLDLSKPDAPRIVVSLSRDNDDETITRELAAATASLVLELGVHTGAVTRVAADDAHALGRARRVLRAGERSDPDDSR